MRECQTCWLGLGSLSREDRGAHGTRGLQPLSLMGPSHHMANGYRIGFDLCGTDAGKSGISTEIRNFLAQFVQQAPQHEYHLVGLDEDREAYVQGVYEETPNVHFHEVPGKYGSPSKNIYWHMRHLPKLAQSLQLDAFYITAGNRRGARLPGIPVIASIPDLWNKTMKGKFGFARQFYLDRVLPRYIKQAEGLTAISAYTRDDMVDHYGIPAEDIVVTPLGCDRSIFKPAPLEEAQAFLAQHPKGIPTPFIAYAARIEHPAKNHIDLVRAFEILKREHDIPHALLCPGKPWPGSEPLYEVIDQSPYKDAMHFPGLVKADYIAAMFQAADVAVSPSLYEGFGLPVIEAMACGAPMVVSNIKIFDEVAGDAALKFEPGKPEQLAEQMWKLLSDATVREDYRKRGLENAAKFTWERSGRLTLDVIEREIQKQRDRKAH